MERHISIFDHNNEPLHLIDNRWWILENNFSVMEEKSEVSKLLIKVQEGNEEAYDELFPLVYQELKRFTFVSLDPRIPI